jgi:hypothetical protein
MSKRVPYLTEEQIERDATALLAEFAAARGVVIEPQTERCPTTRDLSINDCV